MAEVCRQGANTLNTRKVPIIFVPGVMGSRLYFPLVDQYWDPDSKWRMLHWVTASADDGRQEMHWTMPAQVVAENKDLQPDRIKRGWAGVVTEFYVPFLTYLSGLTSLCATTPVYAVGYDWRQTNRDSARMLGAQIDVILKAEKAENFILISHSMGGIVCRACLKQFSGLSGKLLGIVHLFQPVHGATVFYRRMYTGAISKIDGGFGLANIQGTTPSEFATVLSALRGPCELIPNDQYRDIRGADWLWDDRKTPPGPWTAATAAGGSIFSWYLDPGGPPGVWWPVAGVKSTWTPSPEADLKSRMNESKAFHDWLGEYRHPKTWAAYSTGLDTDMAVRFNNAKKNRGVQMQRRGQGDGTVPSTSGSALFPPEQTSTDGSGLAFLIDPNMKQFEVPDVEHSAAANSAEVRTIVEKMLLVILGCVEPAPDTPASAALA